MRSMITIVLLMLVYVLNIGVACAKDDPFVAFYKDNTKCRMLEEIFRFSDKILGNAHNELISYGNDDEKFDSFYDKAIAKISNNDTVLKNKHLFTPKVIDRIFKDSVYLWERSKNMLEKTEEMKEVRIRFCLNPDMSASSQ